MTIVLSEGSMPVYRIDTRRPQPAAQVDAQHDDTEASALDEAPALLASFVGPTLLLAACAAVAYFLPVLHALVNN